MSTKARFQVYPETNHIIERKSGRWRWRFIAANGKIMADGGEAYASASNARRAIKRFADISLESAFPSWKIETVR